MSSYIACLYIWNPTDNYSLLVLARILVGYLYKKLWVLKYFYTMSFSALYQAFLLDLIKITVLYKLMLVLLMDPP